MLLFGLILFMNAFLLFATEFMFAKMVLPLLGGTPGVWITCVLFFQVMLVAGYAYAHWSATRLRVRPQVFVHIGVILAAALFLPIGIPCGWTPPHSANPIFWLLWLMMVSVGLPFFAVSTTAPLLQRWFGQTDHPMAHDPYFLYAASNAGSLMGLVGYLFLVEPTLTLHQQSRAWAFAYGALALMILASARAVLASKSAEVKQDPESVDKARPLPAARRLKWLALAFVPSSLMLGLTAYATTDIAAVPLLWSVPLAIYLITFMIAFSKRPIPRRNAVFQLLTLVMLIPVLLLRHHDNLPAQWLLVVHMLGFGMAALICHQRLADDRPPLKYLTEYYLLISIGGALGGIFNGLIAPMIFRSVVEYPMVLLLACALCLAPTEQPSGPRKLSDVLWPAAIILTALAVLMADHLGMQCHRLTWMALLALACLLFVRKPIPFGIALVTVLLAAGVKLDNRLPVIYQARTFFGVVKVQDQPGGQVRELTHGTTLHGTQITAEWMRMYPTTYYTTGGGIGQVIGMIRKREPAMSVAVVGLGAGTLAAYAKKGQSFTFYEIDPLVVRVAENSRYFTYLSDARQRGAKVGTVIGDGRLTLADAPDGSYDLIVLDAFSSDSVPVHVLTREALGMYLRKLRPGGIVAYHISNKRIDLVPLMSELAISANLEFLVYERRVPGATVGALDTFNSTWVAMAHNRRYLEGLTDPTWLHIERTPGMRVWTDDYSNMVQLLRR